MPRQPNYDLYLQLTTPERLTDAADAEALVEVLTRAGLPPAVCGTEEPLRSPCTPERLATDWQSRGFLWQSDGRGSQGHVMKRFRELDTHSYVILRASSRYVQAAALASALRSLAARFGADHGFVHAGAQPPSAWAHDLEQGLPALFAANVFGPPYADLFGEETLRSAPAEAVEELSPRTFYLQATDGRRDEVLDHLGRDAFGPDAVRTASLGAAEAAVRRELGDPVAFALERLGDRAEAAVAADEPIEPTGLVVTAAGAARLLRGKTVEQVEEALRYTAGRERLLVAALLRSGTGTVVVHAEAPGAEPVEVQWPVRDGSLGPPRARRVPARLLP